METKNVGIYIHIPFCKKKCRYCDFVSYDNKDSSLVEQYIKWLTYELTEIAENNKADYKNGLDDLAIIDTIYIGGGTPSFISSRYIVEIMNTIKEHYTLVPNPEITIEVNPGAVTEKKLQNYINCGINRLSIGLQSSSGKLLKQLGRVHTYRAYRETYELARKIGFKNINVDLMIGLPNQTKYDVMVTLDKIIKQNPEHISVYSLILEENTPLYNDVKNKVLTLPSEEAERKTYWEVKKKLEESGYNHYEISNFAKPGFESKHNMNCWNQEEYIGVGVAAHSYTNGVRYSNIDNIEKYVENYKRKKEEDNIIFHEKQNKESKMQEYMMLGLRKLQGVQIQSFKNKFGENPIFIFKKELEKLVNEDLLEIDGDNIRLTKKGLDFANLVWEEFV